MSRSYRAPWVVDGYGSKWKRIVKNYANRVVRHSKNVPCGKAYKKFYSSYDICDYKWEEYRGEWHYEKIDGVWTEWYTQPSKWSRK